MIKPSTEAAFWTTINTIPTEYPWLSENLECDVAVIGCGITAALCSLRFAQAGYDTVMVGASPVGYGGTSASSGMMSIDGEQCIATLVDHIGADRAMMAVKMMRESIDNMEQLCQGFEDNCGFKRMDSLRFTEDKRKKESIQREYSLRLHNGIHAEMLTSLGAGEYFTFPMEAGVYSQGIGAQVDPYRLVHAVTSAAVNSGVSVYENTAVNYINK
jgi:glycine/D-amino acid oxidase-like deaminating enzyme